MGFMSMYDILHVLSYKLYTGSVELSRLYSVYMQK
jgi:hypothetical protein